MKIREHCELIVLGILFIMYILGHGVQVQGQQQIDYASSSSSGAKKTLLQLRRKSKRSKDNQQSTRVKYAINNMYDQIAQESESGDHHDTNSYGMKLNAGTPFALNLNSPHFPPPAPAIRNTRADAVRSYHYSGRGDNNNGANTNGGSPYDHSGRGSSFVGGAMNSIQSVASSAPSEYIYEGTGGDHDSFVSAGGHGHQSYGGGHGWGQQQSHGHGGHKAQSQVNDSAVGLLGFLALLSLIQNVLRQMTSTTAAGTGRKKRDLENENDDNFGSSSSEPGDITNQMLPLLTQISFARDGLVPWKCAYRPVCLINSIISRRLGTMGEPLRNHLTAILESSTSSELKIQGKIKRACMAGELQRDCFQTYPHCSQLEGLSSFNTSALPLIPTINY